MSERSAGVLLHLTSLPNRFPIGDLGPAAEAFADLLVESGQRWWQMLPVGATGDGDSPYQSPSAFGGNPLLLSPERLVEQGLLVSSEIESLATDELGSVDYSAATQLKTRLLRKAFQRFESQAPGAQHAELPAYIRAESFWLNDLALFLAIQEKEGPQWTQWTPKLRLRGPDEVIRARKDLAAAIRYHEFVQWQFAVQWKTLREHCAAVGLGLIGDIPLFVHQSADVWANPWLFKLAHDGSPAVVAGVPPDPFSPAGQVWGVPVYRWDSLKEQNYTWWVERLRVASERFDVNRLDHFIGFVRTYEVAAGATTAAGGHYEAGGGAPFFDAVQTALWQLSFVADDLGDTTPEVVALMDRLQMPGTRVLQFELDAKLRGDTPGPHPKRAVIYTGTHDTDTTIGWYRSKPVSEHQELQKDLAASEDGVAWAMIGRALASDADLAIVPVQDLLGLGSEARMNLPGSPLGNWRWRLKDCALAPGMMERLRSMTVTAGRLEKGDLPKALRRQTADRLPQIAQRAYEIYQLGGCENGHADQDWLTAEREISNRLLV